MACLNDIASGLLGTAGLSVQLSTAALSSSTATAGQLTGSSICIMTNTGATPGTYTTRTAALMIADWGGWGTCNAWIIILANNQGTGVLTLGAGASVTVGGTATVAINSARLFTAVVGGTPASPTIAITGLALGWSSVV